MKTIEVRAKPEVREMNSVFQDPMWAVLENASTAEIDKGLAQNMLDPSRLRGLLRSMLLVLRYFIRQAKEEREKSRPGT